MSKTVKVTPAQLTPSQISSLGSQIAVSGKLPDGLMLMKQEGAPEEFKAVPVVNPIPEGEEGLAVLREHANCIMQVEVPLLAKNVSIKALDAKYEDAVKEAMFLALTWHKACSSCKTSRPVFDAEKDETLKGYDEEFEKLNSELEALVQKETELASRINSLYDKRIKHITTNYGVDFKTRTYQLDENGSLNLVSLDCEKCVSVAALNGIKEKLK